VAVLGDKGVWVLVFLWFFFQWGGNVRGPSMASGDFKVGEGHVSGQQGEKPTAWGRRSSSGKPPSTARRNSSTGVGRPNCKGEKDILER